MPVTVFLSTEDTTVLVSTLHTVTKMMFSQTDDSTQSQHFYDEKDSVTVHLEEMPKKIAFVESIYFENELKFVSCHHRVGAI